MKLDALLVQLFCLIGRGFTGNRAALPLTLTHFARVFGKFLAHIIGILGEVLAQLLELLAKLPFLRRYHWYGSGRCGLRRWVWGRRGCGSLAAFHGFCGLVSLSSPQ